MFEKCKDNENAVIVGRKVKGVKKYEKNSKIIAEIPCKIADIII